MLLKGIKGGVGINLTSFSAPHHSVLAPWPSLRPSNMLNPSPSLNLCLHVPLTRSFFPHFFTWLVPPCHSVLNSNVTASERTSLTFAGHPIKMISIYPIPPLVTFYSITPLVFFNLALPLSENNLFHYLFTCLSLTCFQ